MDRFTEHNAHATLIDTHDFGGGFNDIKVENSERF